MRDPDFADGDYDDTGAAAADRARDRPDDGAHHLPVGAVDGARSSAAGSRTPTSRGDASTSTSRSSATSTTRAQTFLDRFDAAPTSTSRASLDYFDPSPTRTRASTALRGDPTRSW